MLKYVSKIAMDILPSVFATIVGAYIVNHYIAAKPAADAPVAAAASAAEPQKAIIKVDAPASGPSADVANFPQPGIKAKGISEKAMLEKTAAEKPPLLEKPVDKPAETARIPVDVRRHQPFIREKIIARTVPVPVQPSPAVAPVVAPTMAPPAEAATSVEERRDANELARAAIERLRGANDGASRAQDLARVPDSARVSEAPRAVTAAPPLAALPVAAPPVRPLPPPITVATPASEASDPLRPTPPADIPSAPYSRPLDLRAEVAEPPPAREHTTVAEDVLLAAKSVFHAVLPK